MYMTREMFDAIKDRHSNTIIVDDDVGEALAFVQELLEAEADAMKAKCSYATRSIADAEKAAYEVSSLSNEIDNEAFGDGD
jgi:hypothetical protein